MKKYILIVVYLLWVFSSAQAGESATAEDPLASIDKELQWISGISSSYSKSTGIKKAQACLNGDVSSHLCELTEYVRRHHIYKYNLKEIFTSKVVYVGEIHIRNNTRDFLIKNMKSIKEAGYGYLAMEMWNSSEQEFIDKYNQGLVSDEDFAEQFKMSWGYETKEYIDLMAAAKSTNIKILGIDVRDAVPKGLAFTEEISYRDQKMAATINNFLSANSQAKVIVLSGKLHAYSYLSQKAVQLSQAQELEKISGIRAQSYIVFGETGSSPVQFALAALNLNEGFLAMQSQQHYVDGIFIH